LGLSILAAIFVNEGKVFIVTWSPLVIAAILQPFVSVMETVKVPVVVRVLGFLRPPQDIVNGVPVYV
jgi:hypothetical protein